MACVSQAIVHKNLKSENVNCESAKIIFWYLNDSNQKQKNI